MGKAKNFPERNTALLGKEEKSTLKPLCGFKFLNKLKKNTTLSQNDGKGILM